MYDKYYLKMTWQLLGKMISNGRHEVRLPGRRRLESQCGKTLFQHRDGQLGQSAIGHVLAQIVASQRPAVATGGCFRW